MVRYFFASRWIIDTSGDLIPIFNNININLGSGDFTTSGTGTFGTISAGFSAGSILFSDGLKLAQDNSNLFWDDVNKRLGIGVSIPTFKLDIYSTDNALIQVLADGSYAEFRFESYRNHASTHCYFNGRSARGTQASPLKHLNGDDLFSIRATPITPTGSQSASLEFEADANHSTTSTPGRIIFRTCPIGGRVNITRMTIKNNGNVGINRTSPACKLEVGGAIASATLNVTSANDGTIAVGGINYIFINSSGGNIAINDFTGGVVGQIMHVIVNNPDASNTILINNLSGSNQQLNLHSGANYTFAVNETGGFMFVFDGTGWFDCSHAKHV